MENWYIYSLVALLLMGTQRFLYKVSAEKKYNTAQTTFSFMATVTIISAILFIRLNQSVNDIGMLIGIAFLNSASFAIGTMTHIEALKHIPATLAYPIIRLNAVIVVLFSIVYFKDRISGYQIIGILIAMAVIVILTRETGDQGRSSKNIQRGLILIFIALFAGAVAAVSSKFAAMHTNKLAFMALSYSLGATFSFGLRKKMAVPEAVSSAGGAWTLGFVMGLFNFGGFYSFLKALTNGPLSIIASIMGMHFVVSIILSAVIYKEKITPTRITGILLTLLSIIFLRL